MLEKVLMLIVCIIIICFCIQIIVKTRKEEKVKLKIKKSVSPLSAVFIVILSFLISLFVSNSFFNSVQNSCEGLDCFGSLGVIIIFPIVLLLSITILYNLLKK